MRRRRGSWRAAHISEAAKRARSYREAFLAALQASVAGADTDDEVLSLFALLAQKYKYCQARAQLPRGVPRSAASERGGGGHRRRGTQFIRFTSTKVQKLPRGVPRSAASERGGGGHRRRGTQFTCFTSTKVQILPRGVSRSAAIERRGGGIQTTRYSVFLLY